MNDHRNLLESFDVPVMCRDIELGEYIIFHDVMSSAALIGIDGCTCIYKCVVEFRCTTPRRMAQFRLAYKCPKHLQTINHYYNVEGIARMKVINPDLAEALIKVSKDDSLYDNYPLNDSFINSEP